MAAQDGLIQSQEIYALPSPSKAGQKMKTAAPDAKKRSRKAPSADGGSQLATSPGPGTAGTVALEGSARQRGNLSGASSSSCSSNSMSPVQAQNVKVVMQGTPPPAAAAAGGLQARLRPGGLLDAMRQRGTHPGSGFQSPHLAPAPGVVPATPRSFGTGSGAAMATSSSSTATPGGCSRNISSTGSTCSPGPGSSAPLAASPPQNSGVAAVPLPPASLMPPGSPAKTISRNFDYSLSPLLPKAAQAQERMEASLTTAAATPSCSSSTESRKRSREEGSPAPSSTAPAAPVAVVAAAETPFEQQQQQQQRSAQHPAVHAVLQQQAQAQQVQKAGKAPRKRSGNKGDAGLPASPARAASPAARAPGGSPATSPVRARAEPGSARAKRPPVPSFKKQPPASPPQPEPWQLVRQIKLSPKDPSENYELSDKGSDSEAEEPDRTQKFTPAWSENYLELLDAQADIDADSIFSTRVPHCDLDLIFLDKDYLKFRTERPRRKRGSSGEWRRDRLSRAEISEYKRKMGHNRRWDTRKEAKSAASAKAAEGLDVVRALR